MLAMARAMSLNALLGMAASNVDAETIDALKAELASL